MKYVLSIIFALTSIMLGTNAIAASSNTSHNRQVYAACTKKVDTAYAKFLNTGTCAKTMICIRRNMKMYGATRNILIDSMVKCSNTQCHMAIQKYDYSGRLLKCIKSGWKK
jgi:hypothetical protein